MMVTLDDGPDIQNGRAGRIDGFERLSRTLIRMSGGYRVATWNRSKYLKRPRLEEDGEQWND